MNPLSQPGPRGPKPRRGRVRLGGAVALAAAVVWPGALPASASVGPGVSWVGEGSALAPQQDIPFAGYTCDRSYVGRKGKGWGYQRCTASLGLPDQGRIDGAFFIKSRDPADRPFWCGEGTEENFPAGEAELPDRVVGFHCIPLTS